MDELGIEQKDKRKSLYCWMENNAVQIQVTDDSDYDYNLSQIGLTNPEAVQLRDKLNELLGH